MCCLVSQPPPSCCLDSYCFAHGTVDRGVSLNHTVTVAQCWHHIACPNCCLVFRYSDFEMPFALTSNSLVPGTDQHLNYICRIAINKLSMEKLSSSERIKNLQLLVQWHCAHRAHCLTLCEIHAGWWVRLMLLFCLCLFVFHWNSWICRCVLFSDARTHSTFISSTKWAANWEALQQVERGEGQGSSAPRDVGVCTG